jgi:hypothetical protein
MALAIGATGVFVALSAFGEGGPTTAPLESPTTSSALNEGRALDPKEGATIPVGHQGQVRSITAAAGQVWVTASGVPGGGGVDRAALLRLDPAKNAVVETIPIEGSPSWETGGGGVVSADGSLWVAGGAQTGDGQSQAILSRVDSANGDILATIPLGGQFGADVAVNSDAVWVAIFGAQSAEVVRVDPSTNAVVGKIRLPSGYVRRIVAIEGAVMVEEEEWGGGSGPCGFLTTIDPSTDSILAREPVSADCNLASLKVWDGQVWAAFGGHFAPIDPHTTRSLGGGFAFEPNHEPRGFLVTDPSGIWFSAYPGADGDTPDRLTRIDPTTGKIAGYLSLDHGPIDGAVLDGSLWILNYDGTVTRVDLFA